MDGRTPIPDQVSAFLEHSRSNRGCLPAMCPCAGLRPSPYFYRNGKNGDRRDVTEIRAAPDHRRSLATRSRHNGTPRDRMDRPHRSARSRTRALTERATRVRGSTRLGYCGLTNAMERYGPTRYERVSCGVRSAHQRPLDRPASKYPPNPPIRSPRSSAGCGA